MKYFSLALAFLFMVLAPPSAGSEIKKANFVSIKRLAQALDVKEFHLSLDLSQFILVQKLESNSVFPLNTFVERDGFVFLVKKKKEQEIMWVFSGLDKKSAEKAYLEFSEKTAGTGGFKTFFNKFSSFFIPSAMAQEVCRLPPRHDPNQSEFLSFVRDFYRGLRSESFGNEARLGYDCFIQAVTSALISLFEEGKGFLHVINPRNYDDHWRKLRNIRNILNHVSEAFSEMERQLALMFDDYEQLPRSKQKEIICSLIGNFMPMAISGGAGAYAIVRSATFLNWIKRIKSQYNLNFNMRLMPPSTLSSAALRAWVRTTSQLTPERLFTAQARERLEPLFRKWRNPSYARSIKHLDLDDFATPAQLDRYLRRNGFKKISSCLNYPNCGRPEIKIDFYLHRDGGVVKIKPDGDPTARFRKEPHASKIMLKEDVFDRIPKRFQSREHMREFADEWLGFDDEVLKVSNTGGSLIPKAAEDVTEFYTETAAQRRLVDTLMKEVHRSLEGDLTSWIPREIPGTVLPSELPFWSASAGASGAATAFSRGFCHLDRNAFLIPGIGV